MRAQTGQRESIYRIVAVEEGRELKAALSDTLGIETIVAKERRLFLWRGFASTSTRSRTLGD